jgi:hypothetical protein
MRSYALLPTVSLALVAVAGACTGAGSTTRESDLSEGGGRTGDALGPNDVSILWPLPEEGPAPPGYLKIHPGAGERGPYFPLDQIDTFPQLHGDLPNDVVRPTTRVVAMRVDPCAAGSVPGSCVRELRLSAQTIDVALHDAAIHLVYRLDEAAFGALVADLSAWKSHSPVPTGDRLSVHPGLAAAGIDSAFASELHDIVLRYATKDALARLTFNVFAFDIWMFLKFDKTERGWERTAIPGLEPGTTSQAWERHGFVESLDDPSGLITPEPAMSMAALHRSDALANGTSSAPVLAARDAVLHFENPTVSDAENADCVSCHMAGQTHLWAEAHGVSFDAPSRYVPAEGYDVRADVPPALRGNLGSTLAFGWHRIASGSPEHAHKLYPEISARVAHETAETLAQLQQENLSSRGP